MEPVTQAQQTTAPVQDIPQQQVVQPQVVQPVQAVVQPVHAVVQQPVIPQVVQPVMQPVQQVMPVQPVVAHTQALPPKKNDFGKIKAIIQFLFSFIETLLIIRFVLLLLGSRTSDFAVLIISLTDPLVAPFNGTFTTPHVAKSYFEITALLAMVIYALISWGISQLVDVMGNK